MKTYLVGGAVRDALLGLPVRDSDWVVVGATPEAMLSEGFLPVGKSFPVFLHPKTKEEYALARTEKKIAKGYHGFEFYAEPTVTLEEDLKRRDFTINAIAQDPSGQLVDPFGGQADIKAKLLRHVSEAFAEDPVRILRAARFIARFHAIGFTVAPETTALMQAMVAAGEVDALVPERVWKELEKSLSSNNPEQFFRVLAACGADKRVMPAWCDLPLNQTALVHTVAVTDDPVIRFSVLFAERETSAALESLKEGVSRFNLPNHYQKLAKLVIKSLALYKDTSARTPEAVVALFEHCQAIKKDDLLNAFLTACAGVTQTTEPQAFFTQALNRVRAISAQDLITQGYEGKALGDALHAARVDAIRDVSD